MSARDSEIPAGDRRPVNDLNRLGAAGLPGEVHVELGRGTLLERFGDLDPDHGEQAHLGRVAPCASRQRTSTAAETIPPHQPPPPQQQRQPPASRVARLARRAPRPPASRPPWPRSSRPSSPSETRRTARCTRDRAEIAPRPRLDHKISLMSQIYRAWSIFNPHASR